MSKPLKPLAGTWPLWAAFGLLIWGLDLRADDWPAWRGPGRSGISAEDSGWQSDGTWLGAPTWSAEVGEGGTSPLVIRDRVYVMGWRDGRDHLFCLDLATGREVWSQSYEAPKFARLATGDQGLYSGPTSTPEYDSATGLIYTLSADGSLRCWNTKRGGELLWQVSLYDSFTIEQRPKVGRSGQRDYGFTTAPLVWNDWVLVEVGAREGSLVAFDKRSGEVVWRSQATQAAGHTGGLVPLTVDDIPCVAVHTFEGLLVVRLDAGQAGETVATLPWKTEFANSIATVAVYENDVLLTSEYNQNRIARVGISLRHGAKLKWETKLASKICSPVIKDGYVYWAWRQLHCLRLEDGQEVWQGGAFGDAGSVIATADRRLILWVGNGELLLVNDATRAPKEYQVLAKSDRLGRSDAWPHAVLANGWLLAKDRTGLLLALELSKE